MNSSDSILNQDINTLKGVGHKTQQLLNNIGIYQIQDVLFHLPIRYQDRTRLVPIGSVLTGQEVLVEGEIELTQIQFGKRRSLLCQISDGTGSLVLRFFYFNKSQQDRLQKGSRIRCYGTVRYSAKNPEMIHPETQIINTNVTAVNETLTPIYPTTEGLHQNKLRQLTDQALDKLCINNADIELIPEKICKNYSLTNLSEAINYVHRPPPDASLSELKSGVHPAQQRLAFEELIAQSLSLQKIKDKFREKQSFKFQFQQDLIDKFFSKLSFSLTNAQNRVLEEIAADLQTNIPMLRLVQGDVGSGKTIIAAIAALYTIQSGYQAALMAPTELLAEQHYENFIEWFTPLGLKIIKLTGKLSKADYIETLEQIQKDIPCLVIGTHALFQEDVLFNKLAMVVIDEQHRFGVNQRLSLLNKNKDKNFYPHQLVMSATPIPRTLTMTAYGDLDVSIIDELPPNRKAVKTVILSNQKREELIERIKITVKQGTQVYWVCAMIEESETLRVETATDTQHLLIESLPDLNIGLVHGKMKNTEKESIMNQFKLGKLDLLVATTVIEVGVNVPNASLMVIENSERLGLAQLHQLRGRVGRGNKQSNCILLYQSPLSELAKKRLDAIRNSNDGFKIAEIDLQLRGPGELLGTRQAGLPELSVADIMRDADIIPDVQTAANHIMKSYPELVEPIIKRWCGQQVDYSQV